MPRCIHDRFELLFKVRHDPGLRTVPVLLLVEQAWHDSEELFKAANFAPDAYVRKPVDPM